MAIFDMVMEAMSPKPNEHFLHQMNRVEKMKANSFNKHFGLGGYRCARQPKDINRNTSSESISANEALTILEDHMRLANELNKANEVETVAQTIDRAMRNGNSFLEGKLRPTDYGLEADLAELDAAMTMFGEDEDGIQLGEDPEGETIGELTADGSEQPATEGIITDFKLRKVKRTTSAYKSKFPKVSSIKAVAAMEPTDGTPDHPEWKQFSVDAVVSDILVSVRGGKGAKPTPNQTRIMERAFGTLGAVTNDICKAILEGKAGKPWAWDEEEPDTKHNLNEIRSAIALAVFDCDLKMDTDEVEIQLWYDDGGLWGGHALVLDDAFEPKTGKYTKDIGFQIEG